MNIRQAIVLCVTLLFFIASLMRSASVPSQAQDTLVEFTDTYMHFQDRTSRCSEAMSKIGKETAASGKYPLYLHLVGSLEDYSGSPAIPFI